MRKLFLAGVVMIAAACGDNRGAPDARPGRDVGVDTPPIDAHTGPIVSIASPSNGAMVTGTRSITLTGALSETAPITAVHVTVNGADVTATFDQASFSAPITLANNANTIAVTATDMDGATGSASTTVIFPFVELDAFPHASLVLGQTSFVTRTTLANDATSLTNPFGSFDDSAGTLFVPDIEHHRILAWRGFPAADGAPADFAIGQPGVRGNTSALSAVGLNRPGTARVAGGKLFVADRGNARVLIWNTVPVTSGVAADVVVGQATKTASTPACTATALARPDDVFVIGDKLIVSDGSQHRILIWNTIPTHDGVAADLVLGQSDFTHCTSDDDDQNGTVGPTSARTLFEPAGLWSDGTRLAVADFRNNRVLVWSTFPTASFTTADLILGQPDGATTTASTGAAGFTLARYLDSNGNQLAVSEEGTHRVKLWSTFPTANTPADSVIGHSSFAFTTSDDQDENGVDDGRPSDQTLAGPRGVRFLRGGLLVGDSTNNRVLFFGALPCAKNVGLAEVPAGSSTCITDPCVAGACVGLRACDHATGAAVCTCPAGVTGDCDTCAAFVDPAATGAGDGSTWQDAFTSIQAALDAESARAQALPTSVGHCDAWVKAGTYGVFRTAATDTITMPPLTGIYGGFAGTEATLADRSGGATILDGTQQVHHVLVAGGVALLDTVTVQGGNANGTGEDATGGGLLVRNGAFVKFGASVFRANRATGNGGALAIQNATVLADTVAFTGNTAGGNGGAVDVGTSGAIAVRDSTFTGNRADGNGGGIAFDGGASTLDRSILYANTAANGGGVAVFGSAVLTRCTITGNAATTADGGLDTTSTAGNPWSDLIVRGNAAPVHADISNLPASQAITTSDIPGVTGTGDLDANPQFVRGPAFVDVVSVASVTTTAIEVAGLEDTIVAGDTLELLDDGVARTVTAVVGNAVTFSPALASPAPVHAIVTDWGAGTNVTEDFHLGASSVCRGAGSGGGNIGAL